MTILLLMMRHKILVMEGHDQIGGDYLSPYIGEKHFTHATGDEDHGSSISINVSSRHHTRGSLSRARNQILEQREEEDISQSSTTMDVFTVIFQQINNLLTHFSTDMNMIMFVDICHTIMKRPLCPVHYIILSKATILIWHKLHTLILCQFLFQS